MSEELPPVPPAENKGPERIRTDALLRETSTNFIRLIGDADRKARIMLIVNSIFLTISITLLTKSLMEIPWIWISASILLLSNVLTLFLSVKSVQPEFTRHLSAGNGDTILHYKKCSEMPLEVYKEQLLDTMEDNGKKMDAIIKEMYHYGNLLTVKYRLLHRAYRIFSAGVLLALLSYLIILLLRVGPLTAD